MVQQALGESANKGALNALLRLIEETVPLPHITIENSERPEALPGPFDGTKESQIRTVMEQALASLVASGYTAKEAAHRQRTIWPFELFPALLQSVVEAHEEKRARPSVRECPQSGVGHAARQAESHS